MSWDAVMAVVMAASAGIGLVVWAVRAEGRSRSNEAAATEAKRIAITCMNDLASFREKVAQEYVTTTALAVIRVEITEALNRLGDRLDRLLERRT